MALMFGYGGQTSAISGSINGSAGTDAVLTTSDGAASLTVNGTGDFTVTFGSSFLSTPVVVATPVDATFATTESHSVTVQAVSTASVQFNVVTLTQAAGTDAQDLSALADIDFAFVAIGARNK